MKLKTNLLCSALLGAVFVAPAHAQADQATAQGPQVDDIIVTAQKREQSLKDVPISIAAFGEEKIARLGINKIEDLATNVPNLFVNNFNGTADTVRLFIRGIGQNDVSVTQDPSVALYIDGVYAGSSFGAGFDAVDLERIEVLRGPQGTLYGRNATGGAVNLITLKPEPGKFAAKLEGSYGNFDYRSGKASVNIPLGDVAAIRLSGLRTKRDALYENTGLGVDFASQDRAAGRAALRVEPTDNFTIDYSFDYSRVRDTGNLSVPIAGTGSGRIPAGGPIAIPGGTVVPTILLTYSDPFPFSTRRPKSANALRPYLPSKSTVFGHTMSLDWQVSDSLSLRSITGYRDVDSQSYTTSLPTNTAAIGLVLQPPGFPGVPAGTVLQIVSPPAAVSATNAMTKYRNLSQEFQALGDVDFLGGNLNYVTGIYYYNDHGRQDAPGEAIGGPRAQAFAVVDNRSLAAFTELTFTPGGKDGPFHITLGARYSDDKRKANRVNENSFSFAALGGFTAADCARFASTFAARGQTCVPNGVTAGANYRKKFHNFSPSATLAYDINDDVRVYAKVATGYKSGGTSQRSANPTNFSNGFEPEKLVSYEAGLKGDFLDRRVRLNAAAFYVTINNYQASVQTGATPGDRDFVGIDNSKIYGLEGDVTVAVTDALRLSSSVGVLHTEFGQRSLTVLRDTGQSVTEQFIKPFSYAPKVSFTLAGDYDREIATDWRLGAHVGYAYQSRMHTSTNAADDRTLDPRGLVDASISLIRSGMFGDGSLELKVWGKNLFDVEYRNISLGSFTSLGASTVAEFGDPRTYGVTVIARF